MFSEGIAVQDTTELKTDSLSDSLLICPRNHYSHLSFGDSLNPLRVSEKNLHDRFPTLYLRSSRLLKQQQYYTLKQQLRPGKEFIKENNYGDWALIIIVISAFLFSVVRSNSRTIIQDIFKFVTFTGFRNDISRDIGGLFQWQSTIINLVSFLNISLFAYLLMNYLNPLQVTFNQIFLWVLFFLSIITAITIRHFICLITGNLSGEIEAFREYLYGIYQMYRFLGLIFLVFIIFFLYTTLLPVDYYLVASIILISVLYFIRIIRLLIIFINRRIPIFYFILYLCALEILPVVVLVKFITGSN